MTLTAGIDIGGSNVTAVVRDGSGQIVARYHETASSTGGRQVAASAVRACHALGVGHWDAIGIGVPGQVDPETGSVRMAVNLGIGSKPFNLAGEVAAALGCPVAGRRDRRSDNQSPAFRREPIARRSKKPRSAAFWRGR